MKLKRCIALGLLLVSHAAMACGPYYYFPADYRLYRIMPAYQTAARQSAAEKESFADKNISLWAKQTGFADHKIEAAIYKGALADWEWMAGKGDEASEWFKNNLFAKHLKQSGDTEAIELLYRSKLYENIRDQMRSPWHYNSRISDENEQMQALYKEVATSTPKRHAARHHFLLIKCAWAAHEDSVVLAAWQKQKGQLRGTIFYDEAEDYVARSLTRLGRKAEADAIYLRQGKMPVQLDATSLRLYPNSAQFSGLLQEALSNIERGRAAKTYGNYDEHIHRALAKKIIGLSQQATAMPSVSNKAMWRYAAACCLDYLGRPAEALAMLSDAEGGDAFLRKSIRALTLHLHGQVDSIDDAFVAYAVGEVQWLTAEMQREYSAMPNDVKQQVAHTNGTLHWGCTDQLGQCFALSAMQRILLDDETGLAYRMAASGYGVRALQMANVACNYIYQMTDNQAIKKLRTSTDSIYHCHYYDRTRDCDRSYHLASRADTTVLPDEAHHPYAYYFNNNDYSNGLFFLADTMCAATLEQYRQHILRPQDKTDRWMNAHSYTAGDYWQDIIGTHYMRERNYAAAAAHLRHVSPEYQRRMNLSCWTDPFSIDYSKPSHDSTHYKLHFAQRMDSLQHAMLLDPDADRRGLAMLEYTIGLENSFDMCWWLTSYGKSRYAESGVWAKKDRSPECRVSIEGSPYKHRADAAVHLLRRKAFRTLRSDEARARYNLRLGRYDTLWKRYTNTQTVQQLALVCDKQELYNNGSRR
ncbi:MAG: hypothetical protein IJ789_03705 [Bacteroidales bacterium]|nr:hypothetical protein [Bacteroidales bacterium]